MNRIVPFFAFLTFLATSSGCGDEALPDRAPRKAQTITPVEAMTKSDCFSCHFIEEPAYGPAYLKIAARYATREVAVRKLGEKVQAGGGGLWGGAQMSRHPFLTDEEVDAMVSWVLSLGEREAALRASYDEMPDNAMTDEEDGLAVRVYPDPDRLYPDGAGPLFSEGAAKTGRLRRYSVDARTASLEHGSPVIVVAEGEIRIEEAGKYFFRLRGKKTGCLYIGGTQVISNLESDREALVDLTAGRHDIRIESRIGHPSEEVVLEWLAPGAEYYSMVPAERLSS